MKRIQVTQPMRLALRGLQFLFSLIALATLAAGFKTVTGSIVNDDREFVEITSSAGSPGTTFGMLMTYTSMLYGLWYLLAVEFYAFAARPTPLANRYIDALFALVLLVTGIVLATTDYVVHCTLLEDWVTRYSSSSTPSFRCGSLKAGVAFTFFAMAAFLATTVLSFVDQTNVDGLASPSLERNCSFPPEEVSAYHDEPSPKDMLSPIGNSTTKKSSETFA